MTPEDRLRYYASQFPLTEIDSTYYAPPAERQARLWAERTPEGFRFNVKAYSLLTGHPTRPAACGRSPRRITRGRAAKRNIYSSHLSSKRSRRRGGGSTPRWRRCTRLAARRRPVSVPAVVLPAPRQPGGDRGVRERLPDYRVCVELRSPRWLTEDRDRDAPRAAVRPRSHLRVRRRPGGIEAPSADRSDDPDLFVVRFHGRADTPGTAARAGRRAVPLPLLERRARGARHPIADVSGEVARVHLLMNNCYRDFGVRNAAQLRDILTRFGSAG